MTKSTGSTTPTARYTAIRKLVEGVVKADAQSFTENEEYGQTLMKDFLAIFKANKDDPVWKKSLSTMLFVFSR